MTVSTEGPLTENSTLTKPIGLRTGKLKSTSTKERVGTLLGVDKLLSNDPLQIKSN